MAFDAQALFAAPLPEALFHYTTASGAKGILESAEIWASEIRYLNDAAELLNAIEHVTWEALERKRGLPAEMVEMLDQFCSWLQHRGRSGRPMFVTSFTEQGNLLSQWRGYAMESGFSLGFVPSTLDALAKRQGYRIAKCIYDEVKHRQVAQDIVEYLLQRFDSFDWTQARPAGHESVRFHPLFSEIEADVLQTASLLKHPAFSEEAEWRLISPLRLDMGIPNLRFRTAKSCLIPYEAVSLRNEDNGFTAVRCAIVGPSANSHLAFNSVTHLMGKHLTGGHATFPSGIPLRTV